MAETPETTPASAEEDKAAQVTPAAQELALMDADRNRSGKFTG